MGVSTNWTTEAETEAETDRQRRTRSTGSNYRAEDVPNRRSAAATVHVHQYPHMDGVDTSFAPAFFAENFSFHGLG